MAGGALGGVVEFGGRTVARIGFGAMQLTEAAVERRVAVDVLRRAVELGVNHVDTAGFYGAGACNALIREALFPYPEELVLVSKVGAEHDGRAGLVPPSGRSSCGPGWRPTWRAWGWNGWTW